MPSSSKTSLGFHNWAAEDKPARADFCGDNQLLNTLLTQHFNNTESHLTAADREALPGTASGIYQGTGESIGQVLLPFAPKLVIVAQSAAPPCSLSEGITEIHMGAAAPSNGTTGAALNGSTLMVRQTQTQPQAGGQKICLNQKGSVYFWIAFR